MGHCPDPTARRLSIWTARDAEIPPSREIYFYTVQYTDWQGSSSYGTESANKPRQPTTGGCPEARLRGCDDDRIPVRQIMSRRQCENNIPAHGIHD